jgi:signal transduction histidine kinase
MVRGRNMTGDDTPRISRLTGRFDDHELEAAYRDQTWPVQRTQIALTLAGLGTGLVITLSSDFLYLSGTPWFAPTAGLRGAAGVSGLAACAFLLLARPGWKAPAAPVLIQGVIGLMMIAFIVVAFAFPAVETTPQGISDVMVFTAFCMCIFAIVAGFGVFPYPVAVAVFCTGLALSYLVLAGLYWNTAAYPKVSQSVLVLAGCAFGWIMAIVNNVSTRRRFHVTRLYEKARLAAEKSEAFQTFLLAASGHDIRQPLYALDLNASALEAMAARGDLEQVRRLARRQKTMARNMSGLLAAMIELSTLDLGRRRAQAHPVPLNALIGDAADPLLDLAEEKGIRVRSLPSRLRADIDPGILVHVISNLLANAINHSGATRVVVGVKRRGGAVEVIVADNGKGLSPRPAQIRSIADLRDEERATRLHTGLGMEIMFGLCDRGGLRLTITSRPGSGVLAAVTCPRSAAPKA